MHDIARKGDMDTYGLDFWKAYKAAGFVHVTGRDGRSARISQVTTANVFVCYAGDSRRYATHPHDIQPANRATLRYVSL